VLAGLAGPDTVTVGQGGWLSVRVGSDRIGDLNRALGAADIWATGLESGNDLELLFLQLTGGEPPPDGASVGFGAAGADARPPSDGAVDR